jgi:hypothetical protein
VTERDAQQIVDRRLQLRAFAQPFADHAAEGLNQEWMRWAGWLLHVGCDECWDRGNEAACFGVAGCHGYSAGCGCTGCAERQVRELAKLERPPATIAGRRLRGLAA